MPTVQETIQQFKSALSAIYREDEAGAMANQVAEHVLHKNRLELSLSRQENVSEAAAQSIKAIQERLLLHEPLQYVLGSAHFYDLELLVDERVLIPRPETEELVDRVVKEHRGKTGLRVLDICSGSGCIPLALAANLDTAKVYGLEVSEGALEVAKANAAKYKLPIEWLHQDVFEDITSIAPHSLNIITSNPPYVLEEEQARMRPNVLEYEPHLALFVPDTDPLRFYKRIAELAANLLHKGGKLYFEINERYGAEVREQLLQAGFSEAGIIQDLFGKERIVQAIL
ncbi:peptide chain release factor N(5)-glutamine methyltransferase [Pontibacter vulgaris]|uniref:peptide chain release factor N(5)-glutamine methyltransferase n=1 Tax=Pontibacter vulgaris TaxID=2905679 RepID=UPI001FA7CA0B